MCYEAPWNINSITWLNYFCDDCFYSIYILWHCIYILGLNINTSWAIDPFGHSPTIAYFNKKAGIKNMLIQRTHFAVKRHFAKRKYLEFHWQQPWGKTLPCRATMLIQHWINIDSSSWPCINVVSVRINAVWQMGVFYIFKDCNNLWMYIGMLKEHLEI